MIDHRQVSRAAGAALTAVGLLLVASVAHAQSTPQIATVPRTGGPTPPAGMWAGCTVVPTNGGVSTTCPVVQYGGYTTWAFTYVDNRVAYGLVSYDAQGNVVKSVQRDGARYPYKMTVNAAAQTVSIWGQSDAKVDVAWADLPQPAAPATPFYTWTPASAPPANVVRSPVAPSYPVCRGTNGGPPGKFWVGWWDNGICHGSYGNTPQSAAGNLQFLTVVSGAAQWTTPTAGPTVPTLPAGAVSGGPTPSGDYNQPICAYTAFVGWVYTTLCEHSGGYPPGGSTSVLIGALQ